MFERDVLVNFLLFQVTWFACVIGGGVYGNIWPGVGCVTLLILTLRHSRSMRQDVMLAIGAMLFGWLLDTAWSRLGVVEFPGLTIAPSWIVLLWLAVALTVNHSLRFLRDRPLLGAIVVGLAAPVTYLVGDRLGAVVLPDPVQLWMVSLAWAVLFYIGFVAARRSLVLWADHAATRPG